MADAVQQALAALEAEKQDLIARLEQVRAAIVAVKAVVASGRRQPSTKALAGKAAMNGTEAKVSWAAVTEDLLREKGEPLHISEILDGLKERGLPVENTRPVRSTVVGIIGRKARNGETFAHLGKSTFGLREWADQNAKSLIDMATDIQTGDAADQPAITQTEAMMFIVARHRGITPAEVVEILGRQLGEPEEVAQERRNSRMTRLGQLVGKRILKIDGKLYPM